MQRPTQYYVPHIWEPFVEGSLTWSCHTCTALIAGIRKYMPSNNCARANMAVHFLRPLFGRPGRWSVYSRTCLVPRLLSQRDNFSLLLTRNASSKWLSTLGRYGYETTFMHRPTWPEVGRSPCSGPMSIGKWRLRKSCTVCAENLTMDQSSWLNVMLVEIGFTEGMLTDTDLAGKGGWRFPVTIFTAPQFESTISRL